MKNIITTVILVWTIGANGQYIGKNLNIGDNMPIFYISKMLNSSIKLKNTAYYKDKLLIIDFWGTGCSSCIEALPRMELLQKKFGDKIAIMPVTSERESEVMNFLKNNRYTKHLNLPIVVEDLKFKNYFNYKYVSHEVWIYKGKVIGITDLEYVDEQNIIRVLEGQRVSWPVKNDFYTFDPNRPLFKINEKQVDVQSTAISYAAISDFREKYSSSFLPGIWQICRDSITKTIRFYVINQSVFSIYMTNWSRVNNRRKKNTPSNMILPNQVLWEVGDRSKYIYEKEWGYRQDWIRKNGICFESMYADTGQTDSTVFMSVIADLNRLLGLNVRWEKHVEKVLVLERNGASLKPSRMINQAGYRKCKISELVYMLNQKRSNPYVFNEVGEDDPEVLLNVGLLDDISSINHMLKNYGFNFKKEDREVDKIVFSEINGGKLVDGHMQIEAQKRRIASNSKEIEPQDNLKFLKSNKVKDGVILTTSGLQYKVIRQGKGGKPSITSKLLVQYEGRLVNGKIFDSSYEKGKPLEITVDKVIPGLAEALQMMPEGSKWELYIPAEIAYGNHTNGGSIPRNSTLIFEIELLKILSNY